MAKKGSGDSGADRPRKAKERRSDETAEYELGEDFLQDLDAESDEPDGDDEGQAEDREFADPVTGEEDVALGEDEDGEDEDGEEDLDDDELDEDDEELDDEDLDDDELDPEDDLDELIAAETEEWSADEDEDEDDDDEDDDGDEDDEEDSEEVEAATAVAAAAPAGGRSVTTALAAPVRRLGRVRFPLWAKFSLASILIVASTATATSASVLLYLGDIGDAIRPGKEYDGIKLPEPSEGEPQTIMIMGSDQRPEDAFYAKQNGQQVFRGLSDTTMLLRLDPGQDAIALFSLPRDLKVEIPGYGTNKLNAAYSFGGPRLTYETIQKLTTNPDIPELTNGLQINHLVNVDFEGFARAVNAIDCVYIDVDRRYYNKNEIGDGEDDYEEIDLQPGYQALCGFDALDYARYRHTDNDVVRAARQQDFLREARQKVPPERLFAERKELVKIFTKHTTSDIDTASTMLEVLKLFVAARDAEVREVHFEGTLGPSYVTATQDEIDKAVAQFLGIEDTEGPRGDSANPRSPAEAAKTEAAARNAALQAKRKKNEARKVSNDAQLSNVAGFASQLAKKIRRARLGLPVLYPKVLEVGSQFAEEPRAYKINGTGDGSPGVGERAAYKWVFSRPALGEYYGFMATRWKDPPILDNPSEEREINGRNYKFYYDGDRLRTVGWQDDHGSYWVSNTLIQSLSDREMLEIAKNMTRLRIQPKG